MSARQSDKSRESAVEEILNLCAEYVSNDYVISFDYTCESNILRAAQQK